MKKQDQLVLEDASQLRKQGLLQDAIIKVNQIIKQYPNDEMVLVEVLKLSLLHQNNKHAYNIYLALKLMSKGKTFWEPEFLTRLQISTNHQIPELALFDNRNTVEWVSLYRTDGTDPLYPVTIKDWSMTCNQGPVCYNFIGQCPSCNTTYQFAVHMTLLVDREYLCPVCLARQAVDYEIIKTAIKEKQAKSNYTDEEKYRLDQTMHETMLQLDSGAMDEDSFPLPCRRLNIDYLYVFNQLLISELFPPKEGQQL